MSNEMFSASSAPQRGIPQLREQIDEIDEKIVALLAERHKKVLEIGQIKGITGAAVIDASRENNKVQLIIGWAEKYRVPAHYVVIPMKMVMLVSSIAQGFVPPTTSRTFFCLICNVNTNGFHSETLKWNVCPCCNSPLIWPKKEKEKPKR